MSSLFAILATASGLLGLGELPPQPAAPGHCRTFLWLKQEPPLRIAMIDDSARTMRLQRARDRQMFDMAEIAPGSYEGHGYRITVTLQFASSGQVTDGAIIDSGSMRIEESTADSEAMSFPVGGMRACQ